MAIEHRFASEKYVRENHDWSSLKNKPFGEETVETLIYDKTITESDYLPSDDYNVYQHNRRDLSILEEDKLYNVIWDSKKYENLQCMAMNNGSSTVLYIGDFPNDGNTLDFTKYPFLISVIVKFIEEDNYTLYQQQIYANTKQEHTVQVYKLIEEIIPLGTKYLPEHVHSLNSLEDKPTADDALALLAEVGMIDPIVDANGSIYIEENNVIYTL